MVRKTAKALLVALVASFALSSSADAAQKKTPRARAKHSSRATTGGAMAKPVVKKTVKKKKAVTKKGSAKTNRTGASKKSARKSAVKRKPTTKPR